MRLILCSGSWARSSKTPKLCKSSEIRSKSALERHHHSTHRIETANGMSVGLHVAHDGGIGVVRPA